MTHRTNYLMILLVCISLGLLTTANAEQENSDEEQQITPNRIDGKVTDIMNAGGYTYVEVDTGQKKVWAAGPETPINKGEMIAF